MVFLGPSPDDEENTAENSRRLPPRPKRRQRKTKTPSDSEDENDEKQRGSTTPRPTPLPRKQKLFKEKQNMGGMCERDVKITTSVVL